MIDKRTWDRGIFRDIVKNLENKHLVGKVIESKGWLYTIHKIAKGMATVSCEGYDGEVEISLRRLKDLKFGEVLRRAAVKAGKFVKKVVEKIIEIGTTVFFPALVTDKPISADIIKRHMDNLNKTLHYKEFKELYGKIANVCHPDHNGNEELFKMFTEEYKFKGGVLKRAEKTLLETVQYNETAYAEVMGKFIQSARSKKALKDFQERYGF